MLVKSLQKYLKTSFFLITLFSSFPLQAHKTIGITQIVDHPSLNAIREGVLDELSQQGFTQGQELTVIFENAQGNPTIATQIAQKYASLHFDVIIPISTPSAQTIAKQIKNTPVVFAAVSDPINAKIVSSLAHPEGNITGVADIPPLSQQLDVIETCMPHLKTLGVVYNPGEINSVTLIENLKILAKKKHLKLLTAAAHKSADVQAAAQSLISRVDVIFVGNDNTVVSGLEALVKTCLDAKKPLFVSDPDSVDRGAFAAYAYDQRSIGRQVGKIVAKVLNGQKPKDLPIEVPRDLKFSLNPQTAKKIKHTCAYTH